MKLNKKQVIGFLLIGLVIFLYFTVPYSIKGKDIDLKTVPGVIQATQVYFYWILDFGGNMKSITTNAVKMNWDGN